MLRHASVTKNAQIRITNDKVYIILAHNKKNFFYYHWYAYPGEGLYYYGDNTIIDRIYRLEQIE